MLIVILLNVALCNIVALNATMLIVIIQNVVLLNVVVRFKLKKW
jgi:hypothetical protein